MMTPTVASASGASNRLAYLVVIAGVVAGLHVWKLPPSLPVLQAQLGLTLVESGFLLSMVQTAGMFLGLIVGLFAEKIGLRRCVLIGLTLLSIGSFLAPTIDMRIAVLGFRVMEGVGFLMVTMPAPALIRRLVDTAFLSRILGVWGGYVPIATVIALLGGSLILSLSGWRALWWILSILTAVVAYIVWRKIPPDPAPEAQKQSSKPGTSLEKKPSFFALAMETLSSLNVWFLGLCFAVYSGQWMAIVAFMPTIYVEAGFSGFMAGAMTTVIAAGNAVGSFSAGRLLHRGWKPHWLNNFAFVAMGVCAFLAFAFPIPTALQLALIVLFSATGGLIPATLYYMVMELAPSRRTLAPTMGWMQQGMAMGQFSGPPLVAWVATLAGGWSMAWTIPAVCSLIGLAISTRLGRQFLVRMQGR